MKINILLSLLCLISFSASAQTTQSECSRAPFDPSTAVPFDESTAVRTYTPARGGIIFDRYPGNAGPGKLSVHNGTDRHAICKLIDIRTGKKICSFVIIANSRQGISGIVDGVFRVIFAYGDSIIYGSDRFRLPSGFSEFREQFDFATTPKSYGYQYSSYNVTLHKVIGGNARLGTITEDEYNKY